MYILLERMKTHGFTGLVDTRLWTTILSVSICIQWVLLYVQKISIKSAARLGLNLKLEGASSMKQVMINKETIEALKPCKDRFNNYLHHYGDKSFTLDEFIALENITYSDKVWVLSRVANNDTKVVWAIDSALRAQEYVIATNDYANAATDAAYDAADNAADYAADYAADIITYYAADIITYYAADNAADNAADIITYYAANAADNTAYAAYYAADAANASDATLSAARHESLEILVYLIKTEGETYENV